MARTRLQIAGEEEIDLIGHAEAPATTPTAPREPRTSSALTSLLMISLTALSKRAVVALASLVDLALIASAFALWLMIIGNPTVLQLIGCGVYALFMLVALWMRRRE